MSDKDFYIDEDGVIHRNPKSHRAPEKLPPVHREVVVKERFDPNKKSESTKSAKQVFDEAMSMLRDGTMDDLQKRTHEEFRDDDADFWRKVAQFKKGRNQ